MTLKSVAPVLWTEHLAPTIDFYRDVLGFRCIADLEGWACLERDGIELMISLPNKHEPFEAPRFTGTFYFRCDDVDSLWERLKNRSVVYPIETFDYGMREFAIRDNNGYILQFGSEVG